MTALERLWAYLTLGAMGSLWGEASPLLGGLAVQQGELSPWPVLCAISLGTWVGVLLFYALGRWRGRWVRRRFRGARPLIIRSVALVRRHPWRAALASRFAYGVRIALPIACGVGRVPFFKYAVGTAVSTIVWASLFILTGWFMGRATRAFLGQVREFEAVAGVVILVIVLVGSVILRRRHVEERTVTALERD